jgi:hypothetical protein
MLLIVAREDWDRENASKRTGRVSATKLQKLPRYLREENHLSDEDWDALQHLEGILTIFETVVKTLEGDGKARIRKDRSGSYGNVWDVVLGFELLLSKLEEYKQLAESFPNPENFRVGITLAWQKLDEYYQRLDETPIYYTALALHPAYRWDWFDEMWHEKPAWVAKAKALVLEVWATDYAHLDIRTISCGSSRNVTLSNRNKCRLRSGVSLLIWSTSQTKRQCILSMYTVRCRVYPFPHSSPII